MFSKSVSIAGVQIFRKKAKPNQKSRKMAECQVSRARLAEDDEVSEWEESEVGVQEVPERADKEEVEAQEIPASNQMGTVSPAMQAQDRQSDEEDRLRLAQLTKEANHRAYRALCTSARELITESVLVDLERCERAVERAASRRQWRTIRASVVVLLKDILTEMVDVGAEMTYEEVSKKAKS